MLEVRGPNLLGRLQEMLTKSFMSSFFSCFFYFLVTNLKIPGFCVSLGRENKGRRVTARSF